MNKKTMVRSFVLIPVVLMLLFVTGPSRVSATETCTNPVFASVLASLQAKTSVPLRLPLVVGDEYDAALYAEVVWVSRTRYVVRIGQNCERSYCPYGTVSGMMISRRTERPLGKAVELADGSTGYITDGSKTLKDSVITWDQGQYRYTIAIYAAEPSVLIKIANSALSFDNR